MKNRKYNDEGWGVDVLNVYSPCPNGNTVRAKSLQKTRKDCALFEKQLLYSGPCQSQISRDLGKFQAKGHPGQNSSMTMVRPDELHRMGT
eukprot:10409827-Karenia_brevis.AAC.1